MKTLLIVPPNIDAIEPFCSSQRMKDYVKFIKGFPLGLGYIAAVLENNNMDVEILDAQIKALSMREISDFIKISAPGVIGITTLTASIKTAVEIARMAKAINKEIIVVFGGPHAMYDYDNLLKNYDVDFIVIGEGEFIFLNLVKSIDEKLPLEKVEGIIYKRDGEVKVNKGSVFIDELDNLPFPARHLTDFNAYLRHFTHDLPSAVQILTSRGCPYQCAFCSSGSTFSKWRGRSPENIVSEIKDVVNRYPQIKSISFMDDNFTLDRKRVIDICNLIAKEGLKRYPWDCLSRCGNLDEDMLGLMKRAGCVRIQYGIESGSPPILENIGKRIDLKMAKEGVAMTKKSGIEAYAFFMVGNPGETQSSIRASVKYAFELKSTYVNWFVTQVYPGTKLAQLQPQKDWVNYVYEPEIKNPSLYTHPCVPTFNPDGFDREILKNKVADIMRLFFWTYLPLNFRKWFMKFVRHPLYSLGYIKKILLQ